ELFGVGVRRGLRGAARTGLGRRGEEGDGRHRGEGQRGAGHVRGLECFGEPGDVSPPEDRTTQLRGTHVPRLASLAGSATNSLSNLPVAASCSHTLPSNPADTTVRPSGCQATVYAGPVTFSNATFLPESVSYTRT